MAIILADIVLFLHACYAAFVLGGLLLLPIGLRLHWRWSRARTFRLTHLMCTAFVAVETLIGLTCPLTWLENVLRVASTGAGYDHSFIGHIIYWLLYYDASAWVFVVVYTVLTLAVVLLYAYMPPLPQPSRPRPSGLHRTASQDN
jgi:hypothetical protein